MQSHQANAPALASAGSGSQASARTPTAAFAMLVPSVAVDSIAQLIVTKETKCSDRAQARQCATWTVRRGRVAHCWSWSASRQWSEKGGLLVQVSWGWAPVTQSASLVTARSRQASALPCACAMAVACCQTPTGLPHATLTSFMLFGSNGGRGFLDGIW